MINEHEKFLSYLEGSIRTMQYFLQKSEFSKDSIELMFVSLLEDIGAFREEMKKESCPTWYEELKKRDEEYRKKIQPTLETFEDFENKNATD